MKPIIIETRDNKIVMDVSEFKKHMDDAYWQGYRDASSTSTVQYNNNSPWWNYLTVNGPSITATDSTNSSTLNNDALNATTGTVTL